MLQFTHDGQTVPVDLDNLPLHEGMALQKATGLRLKEFADAMQSGDLTVFAALGWVLIKFRMGRSEVTFDDVCEGRVVITFGDFDDPDARATAEANGEVPPRSRGGRAKTRT